MPEPINTAHKMRDPLLFDIGTSSQMKQEKGKGDQAPRCLVIDDTPDVLHYVARMLTRLGYQVDTAVTKADVTARLADCQYELIVTDLEMPDMSGYHLAITIKSVSRETKVIIMTGRDPGDCMAMMCTGWADKWLFKPFGLMQLRQAIEACGCCNKFAELAREQV
jgi:adenylate cyclase